MKWNNKDIQDLVIVLYESTNSCLFYVFFFFVHSNIVHWIIFAYECFWRKIKISKRRYHTCYHQRYQWQYPILFFRSVSIVDYLIMFNMAGRKKMNTKKTGQSTFLYIYIYIVSNRRSERTHIKSLDFAWNRMSIAVGCSNIVVIHWQCAAVFLFLLLLLLLLICM